MKKILILFLFQIFLIADTKSKDCFIYYDSFDLQRYFGLSENMIEKYAIKYAFECEDIKKIIEKKLKDVKAYDKGDIKAKINIKGKIYFIDSLGYMRNEDEFYKIDIQKLKKIMGKQYGKTKNIQSY